MSKYVNDEFDKLAREYDSAESQLIFARKFANKLDNGLTVAAKANALLQEENKKLKANETAWRIGYNSVLANCQREKPDIYKLGQHIALLHLASSGRDLAFEEAYEPLDTIP